MRRLSRFRCPGERAVARYGVPIPDRTNLRSLGIAALELGALTGAAIAQPLLDEFGRAPEVFIRAGASRLTIVLFAFVVALAPVAVLVAIEAIAGYAISERARRWLHLAFVSTLVLLLAPPPPGLLFRRAGGP